MIEPHIIDYIKKREEKKRQKQGRIPLRIPAPPFDGYKEERKDPRNTNKKGYVEIDPNKEDGVIIIDI